MKTHEINKIRPFSALIDACWREPYSLARLLKDAIAGVTVGIIAIPLAMALARMRPVVAGLIVVPIVVGSSWFGAHMLTVFPHAM